MENRSQLVPCSVLNLPDHVHQSIRPSLNLNSMLMSHFAEDWSEHYPPCPAWGSFKTDPSSHVIPLVPQARSWKYPSVSFPAFSVCALILCRIAKPFNPPQSLHYFGQPPPQVKTTENRSPVITLHNHNLIPTDNREYLQTTPPQTANCR